MQTGLRLAYSLTTEYQNENRHLIAGGGFFMPKRRCIRLEVKINKEIRNYTESMFFGLSLRQFIFSPSVFFNSIDLFCVFSRLCALLGYGLFDLHRYDR